MALTIDVALNSKDGGIISAGALVKFITIFPENGTEVHFNLKVYRDQAAADSGKSPIFPIELEGKYGIVKTLDALEYAALTPVTIHQMIKDELESIPEIGIGNVTVAL